MNTKGFIKELQAATKAARATKGFDSVLVTGEQHIRDALEANVSIPSIGKMLRRNGHDISDHILRKFCKEVINGGNGQSSGTLGRTLSERHEGGHKDVASATPARRGFRVSTSDEAL